MRRAPLLRILIPFSLGIVLADVTRLGPIPAGAAAGACLVLLVPLRAHPFRGLLESAVGLALGALALAVPLHASRPAPGDSPTVWTLLEAPRLIGASCTMVVHVRSSPAGRALLRGPREACRLLPGQHALSRLETWRLRPATNPGGRDPQRRWARRGVHTGVRVVAGLWMPVLKAPGGPVASLERIRRRAGDSVDPPHRPSRAGRVLRALVTGERGRLDPDVRDVFVRAGTAHLLAVSGLHVGWVFAVTQWSVAWLLRRSSSLAVLRAAAAASVALGIGCAGFYAGISGLGVPALRAIAMAFAGTLAIWGGRPAAALNGLALAALVVLAGDPASLFDVAFALSFSAVLGILIWRPPAGRLRALLHATLGASFATAPWIAALGAPLPVGTVLANLAAVPFFGSLVVPAGLFNAMLGPAFSPVALGVTEIGIRLVESLESPDLLAGVRAPVWLGIAVSAAAFSLRLRVRGVTPAAVGLAAVAAVAGVVAGVGQDGGAVRNPSVVFLDVGQGDAVLLRGGDRAWMVDAGPGFGSFDAGRHVVVPALRSLGVSRLQGIILTHADRDHIGGARTLLESVPVGSLWLTLDAWLDPATRPLRRAAARRGTRLHIAADGDRIRLPGVEIDLLWPGRGVRSPHSNTGSLVLRVRASGHCVLLPGDAPTSVEQVLMPRLSACEVLKLAHHGSGSSTASRFLDRLSPWVAVASAGRRGRSPLPHPRVRDGLEQRGITLYETRRHGAVHVELTPAGPVVYPYLNPPLGP